MNHKEKIIVTLFMYTCVLYFLNNEDTDKYLWPFSQLSKKKNHSKIIIFHKVV